MSPRAQLVTTGDQLDELCSFSGSLSYLHCALAAVQCIVIGPVCGRVGRCVCVCVCLCVCGSVTTLEIACIDPHQTGFVGEKKVVTNSS